MTILSGTQVLRVHWRAYWLMWVYPSLGVLGGTFGERLGISFIAFSAVMLPLFFYAFLRGIRPGLRKEVSTGATFLAVFAVPMAVLALTVALMFVVGSLVVGHAL